MTDILFERHGAAGLVILNRPHALNAVTHGMVHALAAQLEVWATDPAITRVIVTASGDRAFSAGGDLQALYDLGRAGRFEEALSFWRDEYRLVATIKRYRKPIVSIIDGVVMGGGVGISIHGSHCVAGDRFRFAMPEVGIGFFPDVGATWFFPRMPGETGAYLALAGERADADSGTTLGIATHRVASARLPDLIDGLCTATPVDALLGAFAEPSGGSIVAHHDTIARLFAADRVEDILAALDRTAAGGPEAEFAHRTAATIREKSPLSLKLALAQVRLGQALDFEACLRTEFRIVSRVVTGHDFYEGIRAVIIDKDHKPRWRPASLDAVSDAEVKRHFAPVAAELDLS